MLIFLYNNPERDTGTHHFYFLSMYSVSWGQGTRDAVLRSGT